MREENPIVSVFPAAAARGTLGLLRPQLLLNASGTPVFFGLGSLRGGLAVIIALLAAVVATTVAAFRVDRPAGRLLGPCALWVAFAAVLNVVIVRVNHGHRSLAVAAILVQSLLAASLATAAPPVAADAPAGMVWVAGGEFTMGTDDARSMANERPAHRVRVDGFWLDATPVTNADFAKFVAATGHVTTAERPVDWEELKKQVPLGTPRPPPEMLRPGSLVFVPPARPVDLRSLGNWWAWTPGASWRHPQGPGSTIDGKDDNPVVQVSWDDAQAYGKWVGKRLPTEAEWELAAWGGKPQATRYPWGDAFRPGGKWMCNTYTGRFPVRDTGEDGFAGTSPVRAFPPNGHGLYDMAGNVWQWTADVYRPNTHAMTAAETRRAGTACAVNPTGPAAAPNTARRMPGVVERVIKGGSFLCHASYCESYRPVARRGTPTDTGSAHVGFRLVRDTAQPKEKR